MEIKIQRNDSETIISLSGRLDTLTSPQLNEVLTSKIADNDDTSSLILDLKDMDYISSAGLRLLLQLHKNMESRNGTFTIRNVQAEVKDIFNITGLGSILNIES
ncbi:MAG: STAS domain-containing protein [Succinivibrionaceae bacterium]|jgi:anti-anti-sigma factor|nr:STAS domain-containing protein [Succinivibrionaceae bacterium]